MIIITYIGIFICLCFSALFSGLTLALFGLKLLRLEIAAETGNKNAIKILSLRRDSNFLLTTLLWGNVSANTLLTLFSDSVLSGVAAFLFSAVGITFFGEILPQAYFSRHAFRIGSLFYPMVRFFQIILYPVAKPSAVLLDKWLGKEGITFFREDEIKKLLNKHILSAQTDISHFEGTGALNFLMLDDINISEEGELIDPESIISLPIENGFPLIPSFQPHPSDPFLRLVQKSEKKWVIITDNDGSPVMVIDADEFLRKALYSDGNFSPLNYCHKPVIINSPEAKLGDVIRKLKVYPEHAEDDVIDHDIIIYWGETKKIITGDDILGRLLRGIVKRQIMRTGNNGK